ncbi:MAG: hypothetical protein O3A59_03010 [Nitrospirae bacterium]|nr:hypothetical protein [Nitrospirota bacterium]
MSSSKTGWIVGWRGAPPFHQNTLMGAIGVFCLAIIVIAYNFGVHGVLVFLVGITCIELLAWGVVLGLRRFGALVLDEIPRIPSDKLSRFLQDGFDPELGWVRKPNTSKVDQGVPYHINAKGSRRNPGHENLSLGVVTVGDSYTFCRECQDEETWQWYLAKDIGKNVLNFGVGNYGLDQALLRLKREYHGNRAPVVVMGVVPDTLARIHSVWKHYSEFGNLMGFKPRFSLDREQLSLVANVINHEKKFDCLEHHIEEINQHDFFFEHKFRDACVRFPYSLSCVLQIRRLGVAGLKVLRTLCLKLGINRERIDSFIVRINTKDGVNLIAQLYQNSLLVELLTKLVEEFAAYGRNEGFTPVLLIMPMREDLIYTRMYGSYYQEWVHQMQDKLITVDVTDEFLNATDSQLLFRRWHYSPKGNELVAHKIVSALALTSKDKEPCVETH